MCIHTGNTQITDVRFLPIVSAYAKKIGLLERIDALLDCEENETRGQISFYVIGRSVLSCWRSGQMSRQLRREYRGAWYHAMNRRRRLESIFLGSDDYLRFLLVSQEGGQISGDIHLVFSQMDAYEVFRVFLCSGPDL